jgi:hypothetical protein
MMHTLLQNRKPTRVHKSCYYNKKFISRISTHEIEYLLPDHIFKYIHRSFIISISKLESYTAKSVEVNGTSIPIGRCHRGIENL